MHFNPQTFDLSNAQSNLNEKHRFIFSLLGLIIIVNTIFIKQFNNMC